MRLILVTIATLVPVLMLGCMDPLHDYKDCVKIEKARCELRQSCDQSFDKATCFDYYEEYCRTREIDGPLGKSATKSEVNDCVDAIALFPCEDLDRKVDETNKIDECEFLWPKNDDEEETDDTDSDTE